MSKVPNSFFIFRSISVLMDEVWLISLPLFMSSKYSAIELGFLISVNSFGDLIGLIFFPWLSTKFKTSTLSILADLIQVVSMFLIGISYSINSIDLYLLSIASFASSFGFAIWFASTDTFFTNFMSAEEVQVHHKKIALSQNFGPVAGPSIGSFLFSIIGLSGVAILNAASFIGQIFSFYRIGSNERKINSNKKSFIEAFRLGWITVANDMVLSRSLIFPIIAKVFVFGFLPFLAYYLKSTGIENSLVGVFLAPYGIGVFIGSYLYKEKPVFILARSFRLNALLMSIIAYILIICVLLKISIFLIPIITFILGATVSFYQIQFRSLRQLKTNALNAAGVISVQGIISRLATPFGGLLFAFLISHDNATIYFLAIVILMLIVSFKFSSSIVKSFERSINE